MIDSVSKSSCGSQVASDKQQFKYILRCMDGANEREMEVEQLPVEPNSSCPQQQGGSQQWQWPGVEGQGNEKQELESGWICTVKHLQQQSGHDKSY